MFCPCAKTVEELWAEYDTNGDGFFSLDEYTAMVCYEIECATTAATLFVESDVDEDGFIASYEFTYFYNHHCENKAKSIEDLFAEYDLNNDGRFSLEEFTQLYCNECGKEPEEPACIGEATAIFEQYDSNDDEKLPKTEFAIIYYLHCQECTKSIDELYGEYDKDHDYKLSLEEFQELYCAEIAEEDVDDGEDDHVDAETIFEQYDTDDSGKLDQSEWYAIYYNHCEDC